VSTGLLRSAQDLLAGLAALARTRLELFGTELEEEIARQAAALLGALVVLALAVLALAFGAAALLIAVGEAHRLTAALVLFAFFGALAAIGALMIYKGVRARPRPFDSSIAQLERDYEALRP
jgi:uncharacterized membrane protein YqjE